MARGLDLTLRLRGLSSRREAKGDKERVRSRLSCGSHVEERIGSPGSPCALLALFIMPAPFSARRCLATQSPGKTVPRCPRKGKGVLPAPGSWPQESFLRLRSYCCYGNRQVTPRYADPEASVTRPAPHLLIHPLAGLSLDLREKRGPTAQAMEKMRVGGGVSEVNGAGRGGSPMPGAFITVPRTRYLLFSLGKNENCN